MASRRDFTSQEELQRRHYSREIGGSLLLYAVLLVIALPLVNSLETNPARFVIALLPMVGFIAGVFAVYRAVLRADEYQRDLMLRTFSICFGLTAALTFGYGFLELVGAPRVSMFAVWPLMGLLWIVVGRVVGRDDGTCPR